MTAALMLVVNAARKDVDYAHLPARICLKVSGWKSPKTVP